MDSCKIADIPRVGRRNYNAGQLADALIKLPADEALCVAIPDGEIESHWVTGLRMSLNSTCKQRALNWAASITRQGRTVYIIRKPATHRITLQALRVIAQLQGNTESLAWIGEEYDLTRERIRQIYEQAKACGVKFPNRDGEEAE